MVDKTDYNYESVTNDPNFQRLDADECPMCEAYTLDNQVFVNKNNPLEVRVFIVCHKCGYLSDEVNTKRWHPVEQNKKNPVDFIGMVVTQKGDVQITFERHTTTYVYHTSDPLRVIKILNTALNCGLDICNSSHWAYVTLVSPERENEYSESV